MSKTDVMRVERLGSTLGHLAGEEVRQKVMGGSEQITDSSSSAKNARWVQGAMRRLDALADESTRLAVMEQCGHLCAASHMAQAKKARGIYQRTQSVDELLKAMQQGPKGFRMEREGNIIYVYYERCFCSLVKAAKEAISPTYCHCSKGFTKHIWETILGRPVRVEVVQAVIAGAPECRIAVYL